ncbi:MAG TPA: hypothetical protein ENL03_03485, partial [Phycisphaerae bacterium]|nr:hypothetical protein [Phycisphaerae bacterium]
MRHRSRYMTAGAILLAASLMLSLPGDAQENATPTGPDNLEPNNLPAKATELLPGKTLKLSIHPVGDADCLAMTVPSGGTCLLEIDNIPDKICIWLAVTAPDGTKMYENKRLGNYGKQTVRLDLPVKGKYIFTLRDGKDYSSDDKTDDKASPKQFSLVCSFLPAADAFEPNNKPEQATKLKFDDKKITEGAIFPNGDVDIYQFDLKQPATVSANVKASNTANLYVQVKDAKGTGKGYVSIARGMRGLLRTELPTGSYTLAISGSGWSRMPYQLRLSSVVSADPNEPNNTPETAKLWPMGKEGTVKIFPTGDRDYYTIEVPAPGGGQLRIKTSAGGQNVAMFADVQQYDAARKRYNSVGSGQAPPGEPLHMLVKLLKPGKYMMLLQDGSFQRTGYYKYANSDSSTLPVTMRVDYLDPADPAEPNNDYAQARPLALNKKAVGTIYPAGDLDYFKLTIPPGPRGLLRVDLTGLPDSIHPHLSLHHADQRHTQIRKAGTFNGAKATLIHELAPGDYFLLVRDQSRSQTGSNEPWDDTASLSRYSLDVQFTKGGADETEPNDKIDQAQEIVPGKSYRCSMIGPSDHDFFKFTLSANDAGWVQIRATGLRPRVFSRLRVFNDKKKPIHSTHIRRDGTLAANVSLTAGDYYICIHPDSGNNGSYNETWQSQFQLRPFYLAVLPLGKRIQLIEKAPHHLGDNKDANFEVDDPEGLAFSKTFNLAGANAGDAIALEGRQISLNPRKGAETFLLINGKSVAMLNRQSLAENLTWQPMLFDLPAGICKAGKNELTIRVGKTTSNADDIEVRRIALVRRLFSKDTAQG